MRLIKDKVVRSIIFAIGGLSLVLGAIGIFVPLLPTTPFLLLSAWCFLRTSPRAHAFVYRQPYLGAILRNWEDKKSISRPAKIQAILLIAASLAFMWFKIGSMPVRVGVTVLLTAVSIFIVSRAE